MPSRRSGRQQDLTRSPPGRMEANGPIRSPRRPRPPPAPPGSAADHRRSRYGEHAMLYGACPVSVVLPVARGGAADGDHRGSRHAWASAGIRFRARAAGDPGVTVRGPGLGPAQQLLGVGRVGRPHQPDQHRVRPRRAHLRGREERPHQGLRQRAGPDGDGLRRPAHPGPRLLGPGHAGAGRRPPVPHPPVRVRPLHLRRRHRRDGAAVGRRLPEPAGGDRRRLRGLGPAVPPDRRRRPGPSRC
jgi:hypothetical protein